MSPKALEKSKLLLRQYYSVIRGNLAIRRSCSALRRHYSAIMIVAGALLLAYVGWQYGDMIYSQHQLQRQWAAQQQPSANSTRQEAALDDGLTRLSVPRIDLAAVVVEGTGHKQLLLGPGHIPDTPAPGDAGNSVISAHRDTFFRHIYELEKGDEILVQRNGRTFHYQVESKRIVEPTDLSVLNPSKDSRLTLITCYPTYYIGPAPQRLVVVSKRVGETEKQAAEGVGVENTALKSVAR